VFEVFLEGHQARDLEIFFVCSNLWAQLVLWEAPKELSHIFFVRVGLAKRLQVIGDIDKSNEHVVD